MPSSAPVPGRGPAGPVAGPGPAQPQRDGGPRAPPPSSRRPETSISNQRAVSGLWHGISAISGPGRPPASARLMAACHFQGHRIIGGGGAGPQVRAGCGAADRRGSGRVSALAGGAALGRSSRPAAPAPSGTSPTSWPDTAGPWRSRPSPRPRRWYSRQHRRRGPPGHAGAGHCEGGRGQPAAGAARRGPRRGPAGDRQPGLRRFHRGAARLGQPALRPPRAMTGRDHPRAGRRSLARRPGQAPPGPRPTTPRACRAMCASPRETSPSGSGRGAPSAPNSSSRG
jgi:hypothetical protein